MICPPLSVIVLSVCDDVNLVSLDLLESVFSPHFLPPLPGRGNGTFKSTPTNVHASQSGTSLHFPHLSPRLAPTTKYPRSLTSETWGFPSMRPSRRQSTAERLRILQSDCISCISFYSITTISTVTNGKKNIQFHIQKANCV